MMVSKLKETTKQKANIAFHYPSFQDEEKITI